MFTSSRTKWFASIIMAGVLLALALFMGGKWGTDYTASAATIPTPVITAIYPSSVREGTGVTQMAINGQNFIFEDIDNTRVRYTGNGIDEMIVPKSISSNTWIYIDIPADYILLSGTYLISVVISLEHTTPTVPITPWDVESNQVPFHVNAGFFLPVILK